MCLVNAQKTIGKAFSLFGSVKSFTAEPILSDHAQRTWFSILIINVVQCLDMCITEETEEPQQDLHRSFFANPQQPGTFRIDLIDQAQILVSLVLGNLIDTKGGDTGEVSMYQPPINNKFNGLKELLPTGAKAYRDLLPRQLLGPMR